MSSSIGKRKDLHVSALLKTIGVQEPEHFNPHQTYVSHGSLSRLPELMSIPELSSPEALIRAWRGNEVACWSSTRMPKGCDVKARPEQLLPLLNSGYTIFFEGVEKSVPGLRPLIQRLAIDLGVPSESIYCEAFASRIGSGSKLHFDPNSTFNIQLAGTKKWKIAENRNVRFPHTGWALDAPINPDLQRYLRGGLPTKMPADARSIVGKSGSVIYVPHGIWHETECTEPSFAILFTVSPKSWAEIVTTAIARELRSMEKWRERPMGTMKSSLAASTRYTLAQLSESLQNTISSFTAEKIEALVTGAAKTSYRVPSGIELKVVKQSKNQTTSWNLHITSAGKTRTLPIDASSARTIQWALQQNGFFSATEAARALPEIDMGLIVKTLDALCSSGILQSSSEDTTNLSQNAA